MKASRENLTYSRWLARRMLWSVNRVFCTSYHQLRVLAPARLPRGGAAILVCNHTSGLDPFLIQSICPRTVIWMMAREYYDLPGIGRMFRTIDAIPVDRSGRDIAATRAALRALGAGKVLGIFPEGRIAESRELLPFQTGVAMMALKMRVPVYPAFIDGTQRGKEIAKALVESQRAVLSFGDQVDFAGLSSRNLDDATARIEFAVRGLMQNAGRCSQQSSEINPQMRCDKFP